MPNSDGMPLMTGSYIRGIPADLRCFERALACARPDAWLCRMGHCFMILYTLEATRPSEPVKYRTKFLLGFLQGPPPQAAVAVVNHIVLIGLLNGLIGSLLHNTISCSLEAKPITPILAWSFATATDSVARPLVNTDIDLYCLGRSRCCIRIHAY